MFVAPLKRILIERAQICFYFRSAICGSPDRRRKAIIIGMASAIDLKGAIKQALKPVNHGRTKRGNWWFTVGLASPLYAKPGWM